MKKIIHRLGRLILIFFYYIKVRLYKYYLKRVKIDHNLKSELIVSLTSYPARYKTLHLTLKSILMQNIKVDKVILWVSHEDFTSLPGNVLDLQKYGLTIYKTDDIKSYKKIIPALKKYPFSAIITLDDDLYYPHNLVKKLVETAHTNPGMVIANRTHVIQYNYRGEIKPYHLWQSCAYNNLNPSNNFPTGVGGVLYPPNSLHPDVVNAEIFMKLAPRADDVWLYWMTRKNNRCIINTGYVFSYISWPQTQNVGLFITNTSDNELNNDAQISHMINYYGLPKNM